MIRLLYQEHSKDSLSDIRVWQNNPNHGQLIRFRLINAEEFVQLQYFVENIAPKIGLEITLEWSPPTTPDRDGYQTVYNYKTKSWEKLDAQIS